MDSAIAPSGPDKSLLLEALQARYDGRPPRQQRLAVLLAGDDVLTAMVAQARRERLRREMAAARLALARRRRQVSAAQAQDDAWLSRLTGVLRRARDGLTGESMSAA